MASICTNEPFDLVSLHRSSVHSDQRTMGQDYPRRLQHQRQEILPWQQYTQYSRRCLVAHSTRPICLESTRHHFSKDHAVRLIYAWRIVSARFVPSDKRQY